MTWELRRKIEELDTAELRMRSCLMPFISSLFSFFHKKHSIWKKISKCLAEIDVYCSLSLVSGKHSG